MFSLTAEVLSINSRLLYGCTHLMASVVATNHACPFMLRIGDATHTTYSVGRTVYGAVRRVAGCCMQMLRRNVNVRPDMIMMIGTALKPKGRVNDS